MLKNKQPALTTNLSPPSVISSVVKLRKLATQGAVWILAGYVFRQLLRFINNLILTRLLFPELFGLMTLVNTFVLGLNLFSDIGINPSIIQNKRGDEPDFLNTAWTLQVGRGILLWGGACLLAVPVARIYDTPILTQVLPVSSLAVVFAGFNATKMATANRRLQMRKVVLVELIAYLMGLLVMITWAWLSPSIWALAAGGLVTALIEMALSHIVFQGVSNRFFWDSGAFWEIYRFGRWIFLSTALTFLAGQNDKLILGRLMDTHFLGIYGIAFMLARMVEDGIRQMGYRILFPSYAELARQHPLALYPLLRQSRLIMVVLTWVGALIFIFFGREIVALLYDERYQAAGWMLQILAAGTLVSVLNLTYDNVLIAKGKTLDNALLLTIQIGLQLAVMFLGAHWGGQKGVIIGLACVGWVMYPFKALWLSRLKLWQPEIDLPVIGLAIALLMALILL